MSEEIQTTDHKESRLPFWISVGILLMLVGSYLFIPSFRMEINEGFHVLMSEDKQRTEAWVRQFGLWGPVIIIIAMILQAFLLFVPNFLLMIVAVLCYGPWLGGLIAITAVMAAATAGYFTGAALGPFAVRKLIGKESQKKVTAWVRHYGVGVIVAIRASPLLPNDAMHFVGGALRMGYGRFILASLAGTLPLVILIAMFAGNGNLDKGVLWISVISTALFIVYFLIDYFGRQRKKKRDVSGF